MACLSRYTRHCVHHYIDANFQGMSYPCALVVLTFETDEFSGFRFLCNLFTSHHFLTFYQMRNAQLRLYFDLFQRYERPFVDAFASVVHAFVLDLHDDWLVNVISIVAEVGPFPDRIVPLSLVTECVLSLLD